MINNVSSTKVYSDPHQKIFIVQKSNKTYYVRDAGIRVGILVHDEKNILLVKQYRFIPNRFVQEIPGGGLKSNEKPKDGAKRELFEEAGIVDEELENYFHFHPGLDINYNSTYIFASNKIDYFKQKKMMRLTLWKYFHSEKYWI